MDSKILNSSPARPRARFDRPQTRTRLAKGALVGCLWALIATSDNADWQVEASAKQPIVFLPGESSGQTTQATVLFHTPRGKWPLEVRLYDSYATVAPDSVRLSSTFELDPRVLPSSKNKWAGAFEVVCEEELCEGSLSVGLRLDWVSAAAPSTDAGVMQLGDGGSVPREPPTVTVYASFPGGVDAPLFGCDGKDSSVDSAKPPEQLGVEVTLLPLLSDPLAIPVPDPLATPVPGPRTVPIDASVGLPLAPLSGLDAGA